ncbi:hypothetical protein [Serpentinimonas barnesii]|uniref:hypothetical protein n=1 Tax=Serpentinimonas barnesii TaxID=1458427 RepID=UPI0004978E14|nr:hypothetical protein [Serpentinimonas barnesii]
MKLLDQRGNMKARVALLIGLLGGLLVLLPLYFSWHAFIVIPSFVLGMIFMGFSAYATQSATLDLRAFTNDPLGWRKAKGSYKPTDAPDGEQKQDHLP